MKAVVRKGDIPHVKAGRRYLIDRRAIDAYLERLQKESRGVRPQQGTAALQRFSAPRIELVDLIQRSYRGVRLDRPMPFGPFGIWEFKDPGTVKSPTRRGFAPYLP
jgi:hypothetical protein